MPDPKEKVRNYIKSIEVSTYTDLVDEAYSIFYGYVWALSDFEIISDQQRRDLDREATAAKESRKAFLSKKNR